MKNCIQAEARLAGLERRLFWGSLFGCAFLLLLCIGAVWAPHKGELRGTALVITDATGAKRAEIAVKDGAVVFQLLDSQGRAQLACSASGDMTRLQLGLDGGEKIHLNAGGDEARVLVGTNERQVTLQAGTAGLPHVRGQDDAGGTFFLGFRTIEGRPGRYCSLDLAAQEKAGLVALASDSGETSLTLIRENQPRAALRVQEDGKAGFGLLDEAGKPRVLALTKTSGSIVVRNAEGEDVIYIGESDDGKHGVVRTGPKK